MQSQSPDHIPPAGLRIAQRTVVLADNVVQRDDTALGCTVTGHLAAGEDPHRIGVAAAEVARRNTCACKLTRIEGVTAIASTHARTTGRTDLWHWFTGAFACKNTARTISKKAE